MIMLSFFLSRALLAGLGLAWLGWAFTASIVYLASCWGHHNMA